MDDQETSAARSPRLLISLATYNEAGNLEPLIAEIRRFAPASEILVIDDGSPDGTGELADRLAGEIPGVHVIHRPGKMGLGPNPRAVRLHGCTT